LQAGGPTRGGVYIGRQKRRRPGSLGVQQTITNDVTVRDVREADFTSIQRIYGHHVLHGLASFEEEAPSAEELMSRRGKVLELGLPYIVAELQGRVVGYS